MRRARFCAPSPRGATSRERRRPLDRRRAARSRHPRGARADRRRATDRRGHDHRAVPRRTRSRDVPHRPAGQARREGAPDAACEKGGPLRPDHPEHSRTRACLRRCWSTAAASRSEDLDRRRHRRDPASITSVSCAPRTCSPASTRPGRRPPTRALAVRRRREHAPPSREPGPHVAPSRDEVRDARPISCSGSESRRRPTRHHPQRLLRENLVEMPWRHRRRQRGASAGLLDYDSARTWYRWSMSDAHRDASVARYSVIAGGRAPRRSRAILANGGRREERTRAARHTADALSTERPRASPPDPRRALHADRRRTATTSSHVATRPNRMLPTYTATPTASPAAPRRARRGRRAPIRRRGRPWRP